jgi:hypothetical protein
MVNSQPENQRLFEVPLSSIVVSDIYRHPNFAVTVNTKRKKMERGFFCIEESLQYISISDDNYITINEAYGVKR